MEKKIIIVGNEKVLNTIMRENKIRVARGYIKFVEFTENEKQCRRNIKKDRNPDNLNETD